MTGRLGHNPAEPTLRPTLRLKFVDKLFAGKGFKFDPYEDADAQVRAAVWQSSPHVHETVGTSVARVSARIAEGDEQAKGAQLRPGKGRLGSGGATVPHRGNEGSPLPRQVAPVSISGSSTVKRWSLLSKIQRLCRPAEEVGRGPAVVGCGMPGHDVSSVNIHLRTGVETGEIRAGVSGIYRCGSPWLCPVCATKKAYDRSERVQAAANATFERGGRAALVVLTASHSRGMSLADIKTLVSTASSTARKGRAWIKAVRDYGILGVIVGQEVTYSVANGWHYHQHLSVMVDGPDADGAHFYKFPDAYERAEAAGRWIAQAYAEQVRARGGKVSNRYGWHIRVARDATDASDYTAKGSMAWEVAGAHKDRTKAETSLTPWDIATAAADGSAPMFTLWREYMETMPGTRSCVVSAALAKKLNIAAVTDDGEGGEQVLHDTDEVVGRVDGPMWRVWMRHGLAATFLSRVEFGGEEGFDDAVDATERDAAPLEAQYQRQRAERSFVRQAERRAADRADRDTAFAKAYAMDRLRRLAEKHGTKDRMTRVIAEAAAVFPAARPLEPVDLYKAIT